MDDRPPPAAMTPARWQRVKTLFEAALQTDEADRDRRLRDSCAGDAALLLEVQRLLEQHQAAEQAGFIESPAVLAAGSGFEGLRLGPYRLEALIGEGGMGAVYRAVREGEVEQRVAVKLIGRGTDSPSTVQRFLAERQILARLEHPAIARFIDAGTTADGHPYLVMEYVEGRPITAYADAARLDVKGRLALFRAVCAGVQHAHQNLVVHRDLKPSNILVTEDGQPKLLDFGISKLLDEASGFHPLTTTLAAPLTPEYASPEQVRGEPVTTASDVYGLGVVLFELLTGQRPLSVTTRDPAEVARIVCHQQPAAPSAVVTRSRAATAAAPPGPARTPRLRRQLKGDLDTIVLTALRKEPERRYRSVEALSEDVRRYLEARPIRALPESVRDRMAKFVRRNPAASAASALLLLSLIAGVGATAYQARVARHQRALAERRFDDVRGLARAVLFEIHDAIQDLPGSTPARQLIVQRSLEYLDRLAGEAGNDAGLMRELATAYVKIGDVQGRPMQANLGNSEGARTSYGKAVAILEKAVGQEPGNREARRELAISLMSLATLLDDARGETEESLRLGQRALGIFRGLKTEAPDDYRWPRNVTFALSKVGDFQERLGRADQALATFREHIALAEAQAARTAGTADPRREYDQRTVRIGYFRLADLASRSGLHPEAERQAHAAYESAQRGVAAEPTNAMFQRDLGGTAILLGDVLMRAGRPAEALPLFAEAERVHGAVFKRDPQNVTAEADRVSAVTRIADTRAAMGEARAALELYRGLLPAVEARLVEDPQNVDARNGLGSVLATMGDLQQRLGDSAGALSFLRRALPLVLGPDAHASAPARYVHAAVLNKLAYTEGVAARETRRAPGERAELARSSCQHYEESLPLWRGLSGPTPSAAYDVGPPEAQGLLAERATKHCPSHPPIRSTG